MPNYLPPFSVDPHRSFLYQGGEPNPPRSRTSQPHTPAAAPHQGGTGPQTSQFKILQTWNAEQRSDDASQQWPLEAPVNPGYNNWCAEVRKICEGVKDRGSNNGFEDAEKLVIETLFKAQSGLLLENHPDLNEAVIKQWFCNTYQISAFELDGILNYVALVEKETLSKEVNEGGRVAASTSIQEGSGSGATTAIAIPTEYKHEKAWIRNVTKMVRAQKNKKTNKPNYNDYQILAIRDLYCALALTDRDFDKKILLTNSEVTRERIFTGVEELRKYYLDDPSPEGPPYKGLKEWKAIWDDKKAVIAKSHGYTNFEAWKESVKTMISNRGKSVPYRNEQKQKIDLFFHAMLRLNKEMEHGEFVTQVGLNSTQQLRAILADCERLRRHATNNSAGPSTHSQ